jgi:methionyl aminopeptidase
MVGTKISSTARRLVTIAAECRRAGIGAVREGARLGDIGSAIVEHASRAGFSVVSDYQGHGIGRTMHADPSVPHVGEKGTGRRLVTGMAITIEPMINEGTSEVRLADDGWTVHTRDGKLSAQFEHTILVTKDGAEVLTEL